MRSEAATSFARIFASSIVPKSVRSPQSKRTSASSFIFEKSGCSVPAEVFLTWMSATAAIRSVSRMSLGTINFDARGPAVNVLVAHQPERVARVLVAPLADVLQILLARDDRAVADLLPLVAFRAGAVHQLVHHPLRHFRAVGRIDEAEQNQMREERAPERAVAFDEAF